MDQTGVIPPELALDRYILYNQTMFQRLREIVSLQRVERAPTADLDHEELVRIATCVVLLEVAHSDDEFTAEEQRHIAHTLERHFELSSDDAAELIETATKSREESIDLWSFTSRINEHCAHHEKLRIMEETWRVIYLDGAINGHEDFLAHKLAKLFNLNHRELIDAKLKILGEIRG